MRSMTVDECRKVIKHKYMGYLYCFETATGLIKIGQTSDLARRIRRHNESNLSYGYVIKKVLISKPHTNYINSEKQLFNLLSKFRTSGTEVFKCSLDNVIKAVNEITLKIDIEKSVSDEINEKKLDKIRARKTEALFLKALDKIDAQRDEKETTMMLNVLFNGNWPPRGSILTIEQGQDLEFIMTRNSAYIDIDMKYDDRKEVLKVLYDKRIVANRKQISGT